MTTSDHIFRLSFLACILTAGLFSACSSDDDNNTAGDIPQTPAEAPRLITVEVSESPMTEEGAQTREGVTRGNIITTESLSEFTMHGVFNGKIDYEVEKSDNSWKIKPGTWPSAGDNDLVDFYAHTGGAFYNSNGGYVNFTIDEDPSNQHDLLIAKTTAQYANNSGEPGNVSLHFRHVCTAVSFYVQMTSKVKDNLGTDNTLKVKNIILYNIYNSRKYYFNSGWDENGFNKESGVETKSYYTLDNRTSGFEVSKELAAEPLTSNPLFLIPQTRPENNTDGIYLAVEYSLDKGYTWKHADIPFDVDWKAGYEYTINILLGTKYIK